MISVDDIIDDILMYGDIIFIALAEVIALYHSELPWILWIKYAAIQQFFHLIIKVLECDCDQI